MIQRSIVSAFVCLAAPVMLFAQDVMRPEPMIEHRSALVSSPFTVNAPLPPTHLDAQVHADAPTIVVRYLGFSCTHCVRQLTYLHEHRHTLKQHGVRVVAFSSDCAAMNDRMMERMGFDPSAITVVSDPDNAAARTLGALRGNGITEQDLHASLVVYRGRVLTSVFGEQPYMDVEHLVQTAVRAAKPREATQAYDPLYLKRYLDRPVTATVIAGPDDGIKEPLDLDFNKGILHTNDVWVVTTDRRGHGIAIVHNAATPQQTVRLKKDSRASHFMWRATSIAFSDNGTFATGQSGWPGDGEGNYMFMGPTLWSADTAIFASKYQESNDYLASHLDMLHQSPYNMGIAHEANNVYWVNDAKYNDVTRYDFNDPHEVGGTDHRDGIIRRYSQVVLTPVDRQRPAHLAFDASTSWLYIVDPGTKRILRLDTRSGRPVETLRMPDESAENVKEFSRMDDAIIETVIDTGLVDPVGIDVKGGRLIVGDRATGMIRMYDLASGRPTYMGSIPTGAAELLGICIGPDDHIWAVDRGNSTVLRLQTAANIVMRPVERVVLGGAGQERTAAIRLSHDGRGDRTIRLELRQPLPEDWRVDLGATTVVVGEGGSRDIELRLQADSGARPETIVIDAFEVGVNAAAVLRTSLLVVPDDLRRVIVNDGTTESFDPVEAVARTTREGYVGLTSDAFLRVADSLKNLETVLWFSGSFGEITPPEESVMLALLDRDIDCMVIGDDPLVLRNEADNATAFFARYGLQFQGVDVPVDADNGRRVLSGVAGDPVSSDITLLDCQLPRLDHHRGGRYVPNVRFRTANTRASECIVNKDNNAPIAVRMEHNELRTIMLGINPARMLDEERRTLLLDKSLEWLEGAAPIPTGVSDGVGPTALLELAGPNPLTSFTRVRVSQAGQADVALYTLGGHRIRTVHSGTVTEASVLDVDCSTLPSGTYMIVARIGDHLGHLRIVRY